MKIEEFREIDKVGRSSDPEMFALSTPDHPASIEEIQNVQSLLKVILPETYQSFLSEFGGGTFGLTTIFSADPHSEWYLPIKNSETQEYLPDGLLAFSDDYAGGNYVLKIDKGRVKEPVYYWNQDGSLQPTQFNDVLEFIAKYAYEPA